MSALPNIIQGGMGVAVSDFRLANAVSRLGQLGVVSGTGLDTVLVRRLQDGDVGGHLRKAIRAFPFPALAQKILERFYLQSGRSDRRPYARLPLASVHANERAQGVTMLAAFCEVFLAKEGHAGQVGINLLTKVQLNCLPTLYGAMLAGVDWVLMGAGIPREIPGVLDRLAVHEPAQMKLEVVGAGSGDNREISFDPAAFGGDGLGSLPRPRFVPIIASNSLATMLHKRSTGSLEGFVVEGPTAGGHNAPPRGAKSFDGRGQPIYGQRDVVDLDKLAELGLPFWLAGGMGSPESREEAKRLGAAGIQVGTLFAYCRESGLDPDLKRQVIDRSLSGNLTVHTDARASPTGFPFKVVELPGTNSEAREYERRERVCDLGYLREVYQRPDGNVGYRCAAEPVADYVAKGGSEADTVGRKCLCNALLADVGRPQVQKGGAVERPLVTSGDALPDVAHLLTGESRSYSAADVVAYLTRPAAGSLSGRDVSPQPVVEDR